MTVVVALHSFLQLPVLCQGSVGTTVQKTHSKEQTWSKHSAMSSEKSQHPSPAISPGPSARGSESGLNPRSNLIPFPGQRSGRGPVLVLTPAPSPVPSPGEDLGSNYPPLVSVPILMPSMLPFLEDGGGCLLSQPLSQSHSREESGERSVWVPVPVRHPYSHPYSRPYSHLRQRERGGGPALALIPIPSIVPSRRGKERGRSDSYPDPSADPKHAPIPRGELLSCPVPEGRGGPSTGRGSSGPSPAPSHARSQRREGGAAPRPPRPCSHAAAAPGAAAPSARGKDQSRAWRGPRRPPERAIGAEPPARSPRLGITR